MYRQTASREGRYSTRTLCGHMPRHGTACRRVPVRALEARIDEIPVCGKDTQQRKTVRTGERKQRGTIVRREKGRGEEGTKQRTK